MRDSDNGTATIPRRCRIHPSRRSAFPWRSESTLQEAHRAPAVRPYLSHVARARRRIARRMGSSNAPYGLGYLSSVWDFTLKGRWVSFEAYAHIRRIAFGAFPLCIIVHVLLKSGKFIHQIYPLYQIYFQVIPKS